MSTTIWVRTIAAAVAFVAAAAPAAWHLRTEAGERSLLVAMPGLVIPPPELVRAGLVKSEPRRPVSPAQRAALDAAIRRSPLNAKLFDRYYVQQSDRLGDKGPVVDRDARLLGQLGWRETFVAQNLMLRSALHEDYVGLLDQADALLRRRRLDEQALQFMAAVEAVPQVRGLLVDRLHRRVPWRDRYLGFDRILADKRFRTARLATFDTLSRSGDTITRWEADGVLAASVAAGEPGPAYALWTRLNGRTPGILHDERFAQAAVLDGVSIPFEWQLFSEAGYSASASGGRSGGVDLQWDGRGVPTFLAQTVKLTSGRPLTLEVEADEVSSLARVLQFSLLCGGDAVVPFEVIGTTAQVLKLRASAPGPSCGFARFVVTARPVEDAGAVAFHLRRVHLLQ